MKKILLIMLLIPSLINAECQFKRGTDIQKTENGYLYSSECHIRVGELVQTEPLREQQVKELTKALELKDLSIDAQDKRIQLWKDTAYDLEGRVLKAKKISDMNMWLYFGLGILTMGAATYGAAKLIK